ncbi:hypothetical protein ACE3MZ_17305 [Paenibacillus sp. WLX1005]|uniref:hypothetical protein n=1 Tax=Paenibacillus sp. WLX1005 TaxID=3243766 RepID=UPI00398453A2
MRGNQLHTIIENEMRRAGVNFNQLSQLTNINRGTLSSIFNTSSLKLPSIEQLDKITESLNLNIGYYYDVYIEEYFRDFNPHWKKLKPLVYRCLRPQFQKQLKRILELLMESNINLSKLFIFTESWFEEGYRDELLLCYKYVIKFEKYNYSEQTVLSRYRIFYIESSNNDFEKDLHAAIEFGSHYSELDEHYRLDALLKLINIYFRHCQWDKVIELSKEMNLVSKNVYERKLHLQKDENEKVIFRTERHLLVYYAQSFLMPQAALEAQGKYKEAYTYIAHYKDLSWFENLDQLGMIELQKFQKFAIANELNILISMGDFKKLPEYMQFADQHPDELLPSMYCIVLSANKNDFSLINDYDWILEKLNFIEQSNIEDSYYEVIYSLDWLEKLYRQLAIYHFRYANYSEGVRYLSKCLALANQFNKKSEFNEYPELMNILKEWSLLMERNHKNDPS